MFQRTLLGNAGSNSIFHKLQTTGDYYGLLEITREGTFQNTGILEELYQLDTADHC